MTGAFPSGGTSPKNKLSGYPGSLCGGVGVCAKIGTVKTKPNRTSKLRIAPVRLDSKRTLKSDIGLSPLCESINNNLKKQALELTNGTLTALPSADAIEMNYSCVSLRLYRENIMSPIPLTVSRLKTPGSGTPTEEGFLTVTLLLVVLDSSELPRLSPRAIVSSTKGETPVAIDEKWAVKSVKAGGCKRSKSSGKSNEISTKE